MQIATWPSLLASQRDLIALIPGLAGALGVPLRIPLVLDTSVVLSDLRWLVTKRRDSTARTRLQQAIDSGLIVAFAPYQLEREVAKRIPLWARRWNLPETLLWDEWQQYKQSLHFTDFNVKAASSSLRDPTDGAFIDLYEGLGVAAIVSLDKDIPAMGARTVGPNLIESIHDYGRAKTVEVSFQLGTLFITVIVGESALALVRLLGGVVHTVQGLPARLQITVYSLLLACVLFGALQPTIRRVLLEYLKEAAEAFRLLAPDLGSAFLTVAQTVTVEASNAHSAEHQIKEVLSPRRRQTLEAVAFLVCLAEREPLHLDEIAQRVIASGYVSRSSYFKDYLRKVLRRSLRFVHLQDGRWTFAPNVHTSPAQR